MGQRQRIALLLSLKTVGYHSHISLLQSSPVEVTYFDYIYWTQEWAKARTICQKGHQSTTYAKIISHTSSALLVSVPCVGGHPYDMEIIFEKICSNSISFCSNGSKINHKIKTLVVVFMLLFMYLFSFKIPR